jgi:hypothetical protein
MVQSDIICGGINSKYEVPSGCWYLRTASYDTLLSRCKATTADSVFMWMAFIVLAVSATLAFLRAKKSI